MSPTKSGERILQDRYASEKRARAFYDNQVLDHLNGPMQDFIARMDLMFVATADTAGKCDSSVRAGLQGFVRVLDEKTLAYPEYRGNGVMASLGNIVETGQIGLLVIDFEESTIGLHINGRASIVENPDMPRNAGTGDGPEPERWVRVEVEEAYIHCSKHIPRLSKQSKSIAWGTDDTTLKGGDYFGASRDRREESSAPKVGTS